MDGEEKKRKRKQGRKSIVDKGKEKRKDMLKRITSNFYSQFWKLREVRFEWEKNLLILSFHTLELSLLYRHLK